MNYYEPSRRQGKTLMQSVVLRSIIEPTGLPKTNLLFCRRDVMVKWDCKTGEVSSVPYPSPYIDGYFTKRVNEGDRTNVSLSEKV